MSCIYPVTLEQHTLSVIPRSDQQGTAYVFGLKPAGHAKTPRGSAPGASVNIPIDWSVLIDYLTEGVLLPERDSNGNFVEVRHQWKLHQIEKVMVNANHYFAPIFGTEVPCWGLYSSSGEELGIIDHLALMRASHLPLPEPLPETLSE